MKKFFAVAALAAVAVFGSNVKANAEDYNRVGLSYEMEMMNQKHGSDVNFNGFGVSYIHGFGLSSSTPIYLETGLKYMAGWGSKNDVDYSIMNFNIPVNVAYKFNFSDDTMSLVPYLGLNFKVNALAKAKIGGHSQNLFKDVNEGGIDANVFQMGWHVGLGYNYKMIYVGAEFGTDFIKFADNVHTMNLGVTVGYNF
ncbi:MAG: porin family protein [Candidatus Amulumruptor caecigallinarius]|nr:porin family protein [Candidatus Amulumruptor caecigallinarius]